MTITTDCACQNFSEMQETIEELRAQLAELSRDFANCLPVAAVEKLRESDRAQLAAASALDARLMEVAERVKAECRMIFKFNPVLNTAAGALETIDLAALLKGMRP